MTWTQLEQKLSSTKLTVWVLTAIALTAILGTLVPQNQPIEFYTSTYGSRAGLITALQLDDLYHAPLFLILMGIFALNLLACTTRKWPAFHRIMTEKPEAAMERQLRQAAIRQSWNPPQYKEDWPEKIRQIVTEHRFKPVILSADAKHIAYYSEQGRISRLGFFAVHAAILFIILGALWAGFGFKGSMMLLEGEHSDEVMLKSGTHKLDFAIRCDDFELTTYPGSQRPKDYKSRLTLLDGGREVLSRTIEVNHPLSYRGVTIYQASYGTLPNTDEIFLAVQPADSSREAERIKVSLGQKTALGDGPFSLVINRLVPDFVMDENRKVYSRSETMRNPAIYLSLFEGDARVSDQWLFARHANFHASKPGPWRFVFMGVSGSDYTGLQITQSPGLWLVWLGCALLMAGLVIIFFTAHDRLWIRIDQSTASTTVQLAASSNRAAQLKRRTEALISQLDKMLTAKPKGKGKKS